MAHLPHNHIAQLLAQIARDIEAAAALARAAAASAQNDAQAGRIHDALQRILDAEPQLHHAAKLVSVATYVAELDHSDRSAKT